MGDAEADGSGPPGGEDAASLLASASDTLHDMRRLLGDMLTRSGAERNAAFMRVGRGRDGTLQYYRLLVDASPAGRGGQGRVRRQALVAELDRTVGALEAACGVTADGVRTWPLLAGVLEASRPCPA